MLHIQGVRTMIYARQTPDSEQGAWWAGTISPHRPHTRRGGSDARTQPSPAGTSVEAKVTYGRHLQGHR